MKLTDIYLAVRKRVLLVLRGRFFVAKRAGFLYLIDLFNHIDRRIEAYGGYEIPQRRCLTGLAEDSGAKHFIDVGANSGIYSMEFARKFRDLSIHAFEPDERCRGQLYANLFLNNLQDRVLVSGVALSDSVGMRAFSRHGDQNRGRSRLDPGGSFRVAVSTLDTEIDLKGQSIAIKIDVEGHELGVLAGGKKLLTLNECLIQVESFSAEGVKGLLKGAGYEWIKSIGNDHYFSNRNTFRASAQSV